MINNAFVDIQFTIVTKNDNKLPFLDILVTRTTNGQLLTSVYRKAMHIDQILNFHKTIQNAIKLHQNTLGQLNPIATPQKPDQQNKSTYTKSLRETDP
ncbi:hypothetical protein E2320_007707 [Naja naja]|nr:hypothetical protein E2320_007707 [Naja naja]